MAVWVVSGAGSPACNGNYIENGTYNGKSAYEKEGGGFWLFWDVMYPPPPEDSPSSWAIAVTKQPYTSNWYYSSSNVDLPANPWTRELLGTDPAPTVSLLSGTVYDGAAVLSGAGALSVAGDISSKFGGISLLMDGTTL